MPALPFQVIVAVGVRHAADAVVGRAPEMRTAFHVDFELGSIEADQLKDMAEAFAGAFADKIMRDREGMRKHLRGALAKCLEDAVRRELAQQRAVEIDSIRFKQ